MVSATPMSSCSEESDDDRMSTAAVADEVEYNASAAAPMLVDEAVATDVVVIVPPLPLRLILLLTNYLSSIILPYQLCFCDCEVNETAIMLQFVGSAV